MNVTMWIGGVGLALIALGGALVVPVQRAALFPAPSAPPDPLLPEGGERVWLDAGVGRTEAWWLPPFEASLGARPRSVLLFAHGNNERIDDWGAVFAEPRRWGVGVLLVEYPGYGRSGGRPSEATIGVTMCAGYDWLRARLADATVPVIGYGRSLGGGAIGLLMAERRLDALVLESTFTSVTDLARERGVPGALVFERFDTLSRLADFARPVLVLHGDRDSLIPVGHARRLTERAPDSALVVFPGCGHNDCPRPWMELRRFIARCGWADTEYGHAD